MTPTRESLLTEVREKCVKANPDICSADKGFKNRAGTGWQYAYTDKEGLNRHSEEVFVTQEECHQAAFLSGKFPCHPIQLADVLLALQQKKQGYHSGDDICISTYGMFAFVDEKMTCDSINKWEKYPWDLKESLDGQSDETLGFIHSLLV